MSPPASTDTYPIPFPVPADSRASTPSRCPSDLREDTDWASAGHEVAWGQGVFGEWVPPARVGAEPLRLVHGIHNTGVHGPDSTCSSPACTAGSPRTASATASTEDANCSAAWCDRTSGTHRPRTSAGWGGPFEDGAWLLASRYTRIGPDATDPVVTGRRRRRGHRGLSLRAADAAG